MNDADSEDGKVAKPDQKLQREIAASRGLGQQQSLILPSRPPHEDGDFGDDEQGDNSRPGAQRGAVGPGGKRKYRRHPKVSRFRSPVEPQRC